MADLRIKVADLKADIVQNMPVDETARLGQAAMRGQIIGYEDLLELSDELKTWRD